MTQFDKLSLRAQRAATLLASGAEFVRRLERDSYTGREQFKYRLIDRGQVVRGYGHSTFYELEPHLKTARLGTSVSDHYTLRLGA